MACCSLQLGPNVYVGAGVTIGPGTRVKEAIILDRAELQVGVCVGGGGGGGVRCV